MKVQKKNFQTALVSYFETKKNLDRKMNEIDSVSNYFTILSKGTGTEKRMLCLYFKSKIQKLNKKS